MVSRLSFGARPRILDALTGTLLSVAALSACEPLLEDGRGGSGGAVCDGMLCPGDSTCRAVGGEPFCDCNDGFVGSAGFSASACYPATTSTGTCRDTEGGIVCDCNAGYTHTEYAVECTDVDECKLPDQGGCTAWCTNLEGSAACTSTVADESSPYWSNSCDPNFSHTNTQTELPADCRCGKNQLVEGPMGLCQRPTGAYERGFAYGEGPRVSDLYENLPRVPAGVMDQATRKIYLGFGYTTPGDSYVGAVMEIDADTGNRRIVAGLWPDEFGGTVYGSGITPYLPEVQNLALGPDGFLYAWVRNVRNNAQIVRIDKATGAQTVLWREHLILQPELNDPAHAQCPNGSLVPGSRDFVQINERGFMVESTGDFLLSAMSTNAAAKATPVGIVRISKDGTQCTWMRRAGGGSENAFYGQDIGSGASPQPGIQFRAFYPHDGKIWAIDNFAGVYEIDPANGWRTRAIASDLAEDWMAWDPTRKVMWFAGSGGGSNRIVAFNPSDTPNQRWAQPITCDNPAREGYGCIEGPARTCCLNHNPMFFDEQTGHVIIQHDLFGTVRVEVETGNTVIFSL
jgi:hypothetical protein